MNLAEQLGAELAMIVRREASQWQELERTRERRNELLKQIRESDSADFYTRTSEIPVVAPASWADPAETVVQPITQPYVARSRNAPQPYRAERQDGGSTHLLQPLAETVTLPAVVPCPASYLAPGDPQRSEACPETAMHLHTADGAVRIRDLQ